ncbi:MAG: hypothetical protein ABIA21_03660 [Candidatus Aenigmatarchaeota archaeon]
MSSRVVIPIIVVMIAAVVAVSGCVIQDIIPSVSVVSTAVTTENVGPTSPVLFGRAFTFPETSVIPENEVRLFIPINDVEKDPLKDATEVKIDLYDKFLFDVEEGPDICGENAPCTMVPGSERQVRYVLTAPTEDQIANVITTAELYYRLNYDYKSSTNFEVFAITQDEILKLQQSGERVSAALAEKRSSGPIRIDIEAGERYFIKDQKSASIIFTILDDGNGALKDSRIGQGRIVIRFPKGLATSVTSDEQRGGSGCSEDFSCSNNGDYWECVNNNCIEIFKTKSSPIRFQLEGVGNALDDDQPHQKYLITSTIDYTYEIRGKTQIEINPHTSLG